MTLKIWGGSAFIDGRQVRCVVVATTKKRAVELLNGAGLGISRYYFDSWWAETFNEEEIKVKSNEGVWSWDTLDIRFNDRLRHLERK